MASDLPYGIYEGEIVDVSPNNYSALVDVTIGNGTENPPVLCAILMQHGGPSDFVHAVSMPSIGSRVLIIVSQNSSVPVIAGYIPSSVSPVDQSRAKTDLDPLSANKALMDFRGGGPDDILPGDYSLQSKGARLTLQGDNGVVIESNTGGEISLTEGFGISRATVVAHELRTVTPLYTSTLTRGDGTSSQLTIEASTTAAGDDSPLSMQDQLHTDLRVVMGGGTPFSIMFTGGTGTESGFEIRSDGTVRIRGKQVEIDNYGEVTQGSSGLPEKFSSDVVISTDKSLKLEANTATIGAYSNIDINSGNSLNIGSKQVTVTSDSKVGLATPGKDFSMLLRALQGGIKIESGAELPTVNGLLKPGVRIQSAGGGDIHLNSKASVSGAFTTGSIVLSSSLPASTSFSGGAGNYGIVLNSPFVMVGNYPGIEDTPEGIPSPWLPPAPPVVDSYVKHFQYMLTLSGNIAAVSAGLTACFPITAGVSIPAFTAAMAPFLVSSGLPPIGRPISFVGLN